MHRTAAGATPGDGAQPPGPKVAAHVVARWAETPTVTGLRLRVDPALFSFKAGQWVDFWVPGLKQVGGFSIVSTPAQLAGDGTFDLGVKATKHPVAEWICTKAAAGAPVSVRAGGTFTLAPASLQPGRPSLFVAGGIGVTPLVSMLAELTQHWRAQQLTRPEGAAPLGPRAVLIYSSRAAHEFALLPRLLDLRDEAGGLLQIRLHTSDYSPPATPGSGGSGGMGAEVSGVESSAAEEEEEEEEASRGPPPVLLQKGVRSLMRRRVTERDLRAAVGELREAALAGGSSGGKVVCYVCGPPALSDQVVAQLEADEEGVEEVVMERWW